MIDFNFFSELNSFLNNSDGSKIGSPSAHAAKIVSDVAEQNPVFPVKFSVFRWIVSVVWSTLNAVSQFLSSPKRLPCRVISVGNIQAGGAGKTPLVIAIAQEAVRQGKRVAVLTRGYRGDWETSGKVIPPTDPLPDSKQAGDEAVLIKEQAPSVWLGVGKNRLALFEEIWANSHGKIDCVILDDAYQNRKIRKDVEVVAVTSHRPGTAVFRNFFSVISDSDVLVWTKGMSLPRALSNKFQTRGVRIQYKYRGPASANQSYLLVTAVAEPKHVESALRSAGYPIADSIFFPDHSYFSESFMRETLKRAADNSQKILLTGKDSVKWSQKSDRIEVVEPELKFGDGGQRFWSSIW